jgi:hypothetical protein
MYELLEHAAMLVPSHQGAKLRQSWHMTCGQIFRQTFYGILKTCGMLCFSAKTFFNLLKTSYHGLLKSLSIDGGVSGQTKAVDNQNRAKILPGSIHLIRMSSEAISHGWSLIFPRPNNTSLVCRLKEEEVGEQSKEHIYCDWTPQDA